MIVPLVVSTLRGLFGGFNFIDFEDCRFLGKAEVRFVKVDLVMFRLGLLLGREGSVVSDLRHRMLSVSN